MTILTQNCEKEVKPCSFDMGQIFTQVNAIPKEPMKGSTSSSALPATNLEEVPDLEDMSGKRPVKGVKQEQNEEQNDDIRVCLDFQSGREMDINVKIKGELIISLL